MKKIKLNEDVLRRYWIFSGLEETMPYDQASNKEKKNVAGTYGYATYALEEAVNGRSVAFSLTLKQAVVKLRIAFGLKK